MSRVKQVLRMLAARGLGEYRFNRIYRLERFSPDLALPAGIVCSPLQSPPSEMVDSRLLGRFSYAGEDAHGFGLFVEGKLAALCWVWGPRRFRDPLLWQLSEGEAIIVDLMTAPELRGLGLATLLIRYAGMQMQHAGTQDLYTWVWHSHSASSRAFEKAGWRQIGWGIGSGPPGQRISVERAMARIPHRIVEESQAAPLPAGGSVGPITSAIASTPHRRAGIGSTKNTALRPQRSIEDCASSEFLRQRAVPTNKGGSGCFG